MRHAHLYINFVLSSLLDIVGMISFSSSVLMANFSLSLWRLRAAAFVNSSIIKKNCITKENYINKFSKKEVITKESDVNNFQKKRNWTNITFDIPLNFQKKKLSQKKVTCIGAGLWEGAGRGGAGRLRIGRRLGERGRRPSTPDIYGLKSLPSIPYFILYIWGARRGQPGCHVNWIFFVRSIDDPTAGWYAPLPLTIYIGALVFIWNQPAVHNKNISSPVRSILHPSRRFASPPRLPSPPLPPSPRLIATSPRRRRPESRSR